MTKSTRRLVQFRLRPAIRENVQGGRYVDIPQNDISSLNNLTDRKWIEQNAKPVTGAYRAGRAQFADAMDVQDAFERGFDTLKNRPGMAGLEDRPEAFAQWKAKASPEEIVARRLGTRADIDQKINGARFAARTGANIPDIPYNAQKLKALFGDDEANRLIQNMNDERDIALTNSKLVAGSKTAETLAAQKALAIPKVEPLKIGSMHRRCCHRRWQKVSLSIQEWRRDLSGLGCSLVAWAWAWRGKDFRGCCGNLRWPATSR